MYIALTKISLFPLNFASNILFHFAKMKPKQKKTNQVSYFCTFCFAKQETFAECNVFAQICFYYAFSKKNFRFWLTIFRFVFETGVL